MQPKLSKKAGQAGDGIEITPEMIGAGVAACEEWLTEVPYGSEALHFPRLVRAVLAAALKPRVQDHDRR